MYRKKVSAFGGWGWSNGGLEQYPDGKKTYILDGPCGFLDATGRCVVYEDPRRPEVCKTTLPADAGYVSCREAQGLDALA